MKIVDMRTGPPKIEVVRLSPKLIRRRTFVQEVEAQMEELMTDIRNRACEVPKETDWPTSSF